MPPAEVRGLGWEGPCSVAIPARRDTWRCGHGRGRPGAGIGVLFETAVEGAYLNGPPVPGEEMVFQRTRIRINCPTEVPREWSQPPGHLLFAPSRVPPPCGLH